MFCNNCGKKISDRAASCPSCGEPTRNHKDEKSKTTAGLLALFLGGVGVHQFYLQTGKGIWYLLFCWTFIPSIIAFIDAIRIFTMSEQDFQTKYLAK